MRRIVEVGIGTASGGWAFCGIKDLCGGGILDLMKMSF
jgi:hypothetical protein